MATEPEELWVAAGGPVPLPGAPPFVCPPSPAAALQDAAASVLVDVPQGFTGWPCVGRRFWAGLLCEEGARFLDTLASLTEDEVAPALFGEEGRPATRLLNLLFHCFGGVFSVAMDWHTWCGTDDPVLDVVDRCPVFAPPEGLTDDWIAAELLWCCRRLFPDASLRERDELTVTVEGEGTFRVGPAPLVWYAPALVGPVAHAEPAPVAVAVPVVVAAAPAAAANRGRKRKAGRLDVAEAGDGGDDGGGGGRRAHGGDGGQAGGGRAGAEREAAAPVFTVAVAHAPKRSRKVGNGHVGSSSCGS